MAQSTSLASPYAPAVCVLRLQQLAAHSTYRVARRGWTVELSRLRLMLTQTAGQGYVLRLRLRGRDRSRWNLLGGIVYLTVTGEALANEAGTALVVRVRPGLPTTPGDWLLQVIWWVTLVGVTAVLVAGAWLSGAARLWQAAGGFVLIVAALYLLLWIVHARAARAVRTLLARAVAAPPPEERARITVLR